MTQQRYYEGLTAAQEAKVEELRGLIAETVAVSFLVDRQLPLAACGCEAPRFAGAGCS